MTVHSPNQPEIDLANVDLANLCELIKDAKFAMLTSVAVDGALHSRPLTTLDIDFDGVIWFIVESSSALVGEVGDDANVSVAYIEAETGKYASVAGRAQVIRDTAKAAELWSPAFKVWFSGPDDPNLAILRVVAQEAELWDAPSTRLGRLIGFAKALLTGNDAALGKHQRVRLDSHSADTSGPAGVHGEGNYAAAREYNTATRRFVQSGRVEEAAAAASPADADEAARLKEAEEEGKRHAKEEDPQVARRPS